MGTGRDCLLGLVLLAASCSPAVPAADSPPLVSEVPGAAEPVDSIDQIEGPWDVVSFEGYRPRRLSGSARAAYADFGSTGVSLRIECNYSSRKGTVRSGRFVPAENDHAIQTLMGCGDEREARDSRYFAFFNRSPTVERLPDGRLRLRAGEAELFLQRPATRRLANLPTPSELQGDWQLLELAHYVPQGGLTGIGLSEIPGKIVFSGDLVSYSRCPRYALQFRLSDEGILTKTGGNQLPAVPAGCPDLSEERQGDMLPVPWDALRVLHSNPVVEKSGKDQLLIATERLGLLLSRAPG